MKTIIVIILLCAVLPGVVALCEATGSAKCYYIDPVNGNNANSGLSETAAWKDFAKMTWYYQSGYRPAGWVILRAGDYIYLMDGLHNTVIRPGDGTGPNKGSTQIANFRSTNGERNGVAGNPITIKAYPGTIPILGRNGGDGLYFEANKFWVIEGIDFDNSSGDCIMIGGGSDIVVRNVRVHHCARGIHSGNPAGIKISGAYRVTVENSVIYDNLEIPVDDQMRGVGIQLFDGGYHTIRNNTFYQTVIGYFAEQTPQGAIVRSAPGLNASIVGYQATGNTGKISGTNVSANALNYWFVNWADGMTGWTAENPLQQITFSSGVTVTVRPNAGVPICMFHKHAQEVVDGYFHVFNNTFTNCARLGAAGSSTQNTWMRGNVIYNSPVSFHSADFGGESYQTNMLWEYNTIYNSGSFSFNPDWGEASPGNPYPLKSQLDPPRNITFRNNIIQRTGAGVVNFDQYMDDAMYNRIIGEIHFDNNCYYIPSGNTPTFAIADRNGGGYGVLGATYTWSQWRTQFGQDQQSVLANPLFVNPAIFDFRLQPGSPCANMGAFPLITSPPPSIRTGDVNGDGSVNMLDVYRVLGKLSQSNVQSGEDVNQDGAVDLFDFVVLAQNWG